MFPKNKEDFIEGLNAFMRKPDFNNPKATPYVIYITSVCKYVNQKLKEHLDENQGAAIRINKVSSVSVTFKVFIYNKSSLKDEILKHGGSLDVTIQETIEATNDDPYKIKIYLIDTGYGKSNIPNFYIQDDGTLNAKVNGKLLKATEASESLVALYFNYLNEKDITTFDNEPLTAEVLGIENIQGKDDINNIKEAIKVICTDREWNLSCKANALGILKFLGDLRKEFTAKHPSWEGKSEKDIVISEYLDPSDIFLVKEGDVDFADDNFAEDYKKKCKSPFIKPRTLGVSLKKLKAATKQIVEQDNPPEKVFKTPNFFLTGWREANSPKVIYMENIPDGFNSKNNYIISNVSITVSSSRDSESGEPGKTLYFKCDVNGEKEPLFTIRKNGGENFVLEATGSEDTESQGGKCTPLISFVLGKVFENLFNKVGENFEAAKEEFEKIKKGEKADRKIIKNEIRDIEAILKEIQNLKTKNYNAKENRDIVKRAAIAFAFAKKLPFFSEDESVDKLVIEAFDKLGFDGDIYEKDSEMPIYLGLGKDAYYSGK